MKAHRIVLHRHSASPVIIKYNALKLLALQPPICYHLPNLTPLILHPLLFPQHI